MRPGMLLVEDNEADILFFKRALAKVRPGTPLDVVHNGAAAVEFLSGAALPSVMLLDLKMPRVSGLEVLEWMRSRPAMQSVRTVVLTSSAQESDIRQAYSLGAVSFLVKPVDFAGLRPVVEAIVEYWENPEGPAAAGLARFAAAMPGAR